MQQKSNHWSEKKETVEWCYEFQTSVLISMNTEKTALVKCTKNR